VVLLSGRGPNDRDYQGLFLSISEYLSRNGFVVLRFDKRGIGSSKGDALSVCDEDEASDARSAVDYLSSCAEVDTKRILIMAHSEGAFYAIKIASADNRICALVLMAPACYPAIEREISLESMKDLGNARRWTDIYLKLITIAIRDTKDKARSSKHKWSYIMGRRCFLENWKNEIPEDMMDPVRKIKIPVFLISGKNDGEVPPNHIRLLERALKESRSPEYTIRTYSDLGHFLGNAKNDGQHRIRYEADKEMLDNIAAWFTKTVPRDTPKDAVSTPAAQ
jgi:pimeloyl-ACP methyl ester carboxylesterase